MNRVWRGLWLVGSALTAMGSMSAASAQVPETIAAPGESVVVAMHAEGAQLYECKADAGGKLVWQFREPIATLLVDGKTAGRHYAGPNWEHNDGSAVAAKVVARAPGRNATDIPWLKLEVTERRGSGVLSGVTTVRRINTRAGRRKAHAKPGAYLSVAHAAEYVFLRVARAARRRHVSEYPDAHN
jgi:hypothetical protein